MALLLLGLLFLAPPTWRPAKVVLTDGARLQGLLPGGWVWVRPVPGRPGRFRPAAREDPRAGVCLRFPAYGASFLFVPARRIARVEVGPPLGPAALRARREAGARTRAARRTAWTRWRQAERRRLARARPEKGRPPPPPKRAPDPGRLLLRRFPPAAGWTPARRRRIEWKKWVLDVFPGPEERAWLEVYDAWLAAYRRWAGKDP